MKLSNRVIRLFANRGVYILLALGIGIVCVTGYVNNLKNAPRYEPPDLDVTANLVAPPSVTASPALRDTPAVTSAPGAVAAAAAVEMPSVPENTGLMLPLQGELSAGFTGDELVYSVTMRDWRVHAGIDIRGDVGAQVKAAGDGIVTMVYADGMMGTTVVIQHADGIETVYANLQSAMLVAPDQEVKKGDVIGGVGTTAALEISEPPHLHFEVRRDGEAVNPFDFLT
ncbi:MAG: M23 family metallopeptidase [Clostridiales bacterium]|nr:M23 family metallopeptidase [Clostridiales bacterium]